MSGNVPFLFLYCNSKLNNCFLYVIYVKFTLCSEKIRPSVPGNIQGTSSRKPRIAPTAFLSEKAPELLLSRRGLRMTGQKADCTCLHSLLRLENLNRPNRVRHDMPAIAAFGGIHLDRIGHAANPITPDTSTPGAISVRPGGVAVNVTRVVSSLGTNAALCGAVGSDGEGSTLLSTLNEGGVDVAAVKIRSDYPTASYLALHDPDGSLVAALVDARLTEALTLSDMALASPVIAKADLWFLDTNLNQAVLEGIVEGTGNRLIAADTVSIAKAGRLKPILHRLNFLFANRSEASALMETSLENAADAAAALVAAGAGLAVVTDGAAPMAAAISGKNTLPTICHQPPLPADAVDVTGVGDALVGAALHGILSGVSIEDALALGAAAAAITLEIPGAAPENLSISALTARLKETPV